MVEGRIDVCTRPWLWRYATAEVRQWDQVRNIFLRSCLSSSLNALGGSSRKVLSDVSAGGWRSI